MKKIFAILAMAVLMLTILVSSVSADGGGKISMREGNTTKVSADGGGKISMREGSTAKIDRAVPIITVTKEVKNETMIGWDNTITVAVGDDVQFRAIIENNGPCELTNINVTDILSDSFTFNNATPTANGTTVNPNGTTTLTWSLAEPLGLWKSTTILINATVKTCGIDTNTLYATAEGCDPVLSVSDEDNATVNAPPDDLNLSKALLVNKTVYHVGDWKGVTEVDFGDDVHFRLLIENNITCGVADLTNIIVTDTLQAGLEYTSASPVPTNNVTYPNGTTELTWSSLDPLAPGGIMAFQVYATVIDCSNLTNTHNATAMCCGVNVSNEDNATVKVKPVGSLTVDKTVWDGNAWVDKITVIKNETVKFQLKIHNNGTCCDLININISDLLPDGFEFESASPYASLQEGLYCNWTDVGPLVSGGTLTCTITAKASDVCGDHENNASVANATSECIVGELSLVSDTATVTVTGAPEITVTKTVYNGSAWVNEITVANGTNVRFRSRINNSGVCANLTDIEVTDILSDSFTFNNATPTANVTVNNGTTTLTWHFANLTTGTNKTFYINATTNKCGVDTNTLNATAEGGVSGVSGEAIATVIVQGEPGIEVNKKAWDRDKNAWEDEITANVNDDVRFQLEIHNNGTCCNLTSINVTDLLSNSLEYVGVQGDTPGPDSIYNDPVEGTTELIWFLSDPLVPDGTVTLLINATVIECGDDTNTLNATAEGCNETVDDDDIVLVRASLADLVISEKSETIVGDELFNITYTVTNIGCLEAVASNTNISIDGVLSDIVSTPVIPIGGSDTKTVGPYNCPCGTILNVRVCADCNGTVFESHETNNCKENELECPEKPEKPDLVITDEWLCWPDNCTICYNVTNIGNGTALAHNTTLYVDGVTVAHDPVPVDLAAGESYIGCFDGYVWAYTPPSDNITVCADNNETVDELNEDNNCLTNIWMCGDVNGDGDVTMLDVRKVFNRYLDSNYPLDLPWAADVNCDGDVTMLDVRKVFNRYLDDEYELNCCCKVE